MFLTNKYKPNFTRLTGKMKHILCTSCKKQFQVKDYNKIRSPQLPLLMNCGHAICYYCAKHNSNKSCSICKEKFEHNPSSDDANQLLPIDVYITGLLKTTFSRPHSIDEPDLSFQQSFESKLIRKMNQDRCCECSLTATNKCLICKSMFCELCFKKIHKVLADNNKILADHFKIPLMDIDDSTSYICQKHSVHVEYFCNTCNVVECPHCIILNHSNHKTTVLVEMNKLVQEEYESSMVRVAKLLNQIDESVRTLDNNNEADKIIESKEATISQHFTYLHGLLQVAEGKMMKKLSEQRQHMIDNINYVKNQLIAYQEQLQKIFLDAQVDDKKIKYMNLQDVIKKLDNIGHIPCYLVKNEKNCEDIVKLKIDNSIAGSIMNHFELETDSSDLYYLSGINDLPKDYKTPEEIISDQMQSIIYNVMQNFNDLETKQDVKSSESDSQSVKGDDSTNTEELSNEGNELYVEVLHILNPSNFYVMELSKIPELRNMEAVLKKYAARHSKKLTEQDIHKNKMYIAKNKNNWSRVRIISIFENPRGEKMLKVNFIDYGSKSEIPFNEIKNIPQQYALMPTTVMLCGLNNIQPPNGKWSVGANEAMLQILNKPGNTFININRIEGMKFIVNLYKVVADGSTFVSLKDHLMFTELGLSNHFDNQQFPVSDLVHNFYVEDLNVQNFTPVKCVFVEDPSIIYVQKDFEETQTYLKFLEQQMKEEYRDQSNTNYILLPEIGMVCAAPGLANNTWCRATIIKILTKQVIEVYFIDYGVKRKLNYKNVRRLHSQFISARAQAIKIQLKDVKPLPEDGGKYKEAAKSFAITHLYDKEASLFVSDKISDGYYSGTIYIEHSVNFAQTMADQDLVQYVQLSLPIQNELTKHLCLTKPETKYRQKKSHNPKKVKNNVVVRSKLMDNVETSKQIYKVDATSKIKHQKDDPFMTEVKIIRAESPNCIYVSDVAVESEYLQMLDEMNKFYQSKECIMEDPFKKDDVCVVLSKKTQSFLRAKVIDIRSESEVLVYLYDLAETEEVSNASLQPMCAIFAHLPIHAFKVSLAGILPCGGSSSWPITTCEKLEEIIHENRFSKFYVTKILSDAEINGEANAIPVDLTIKKSVIDGALLPARTEMVSVSRLLISAGLALPVKGFKESQSKTLAIELKKELSMNQPHQFTNGSLKNDFYSFNSTENSLCELNEIYTQKDIAIKPSLPPENADWIRPEKIKKQRFRAKITYVDHDCTIYFQLEENLGEKIVISLVVKGGDHESPMKDDKTFVFIVHSVKHDVVMKNIGQTLDACYQNLTLDSCDEVWHEGEICISQYEPDKKWYRGKIMKKINKLKYQIQYVDYGNIEVCGVESIKKHVILTDVPTQCYKCKIHGLEPVNEQFSLRELDKIHATLVDKTCTLQILKQGEDVCLVSITCEEYGNVVAHLRDFVKINLKTDVKDYDQSMFFDKLLSKTGSNDGEIYLNDENLHTLSVSQEEISLFNDNLSRSSTSDSEITFKYPYRLFDFEEDLDTDLLQLEVSNLISMTTYTVHIRENEHSPIFSNYYKKYRSMMEEIQEGVMNQPIIDSITLGLPCCAQFSDGLWYRCLIENYYTSDKDNIEVIVKYIDFGNTKIHYVNELRQINESWMEIPAMGIIFNIWNIEYRKQTDCEFKKEKDQLEILLDNRTVFAKIKGLGKKDITGELYEDRNCVNLIYQNLINDGIFKLIHQF